MSIPTVTITGNVLPPNNVAAGGTVSFELNTVAVDLGSGVVVPRKVSTPILSGGAISQAIWPNAAGEGPSRYSVYLEMIPALDGDCPVRIKLGEIAIPVSPSTQDIGALIAAGASATGGAALLEFQFANRAALVAKVASGLAPIPGFTYLAGGLSYLGKAGATGISDLPGIVPVGPLTMQHVGGVADGVTSQTAVWAQFCATLKALGGGEAYIDEGVYVFAAGQTLFTMDCNVRLEFHPNALFKGLPGITTGLIRWTGAAGTARGDFKWEFINPRIDQSLGAYTGNQPSGIFLQNVREASGVGGYFYGGAGWEGSPTVGGDSAVETVNVGDLNWSGGYFEGWIDAAFYPGGGNDAGTADDGVRAQIDKTYITKCSQGITFKRDGALLVAANNYIELCAIGITSADVGLGQEVKAGQRMEIIGNTIKKSTARAIGVRSNTLANIKDNLIEDWGYTSDGVTLGPAAPSLGRQAILFQGGRGSVISDNTFRMRDWVEDDHVGILTVEYTDAEGTVWPAGGLSGAGNRFNITTPIYEISTANVFASRLVANRDDASLSIPKLRNGTIYETTQPGNDAVLSFRGNASNNGVRSTILREAFSAFQTGTLLSGIGSLASGATSSSQLISVPGALNGDAVMLNPNSAAGMNSRMNYAMRALTDQVEVRVRNDHTSAVDFTSQSFTLFVTRRG